MMFGRVSVSLSLFSKTETLKAAYKLTLAELQTSDKYYFRGLEFGNFMFTGLGTY